MNDVLLKVATKAKYEALNTKDPNTLYFITDEKVIMKGSEDFTQSVIIATELPATGQIQGKLYIVGNKGSIWNGTAWVTVFDKPVIVDDLTTGGSDKFLSAEQGKVLKGQIDTHADVLAGTTAGHVKTGGDVEITDGIITVKKVNGADWTTVKKNLDDAIELKAPKADPTFTGTVTVPTPTTNNAAANKSYVDSKIAANDSMRFKGTLGTDGTITKIPTTDVRVGDTYRVITADTYVGVACEIGDMVIALKNGASTDADWTVVQTNIDGAVVGPASATDATVVLFDGATGKRIKGSTITLAQITSAVQHDHTHANKDTIDTYNKTQTELLTAAQTTAQGLVDTAKKELQGKIDGIQKSYSLSDLTDVLLTGDDAPTAGQVLYYDGTTKKWKAMSLGLTNKLDKVAQSHADEIVIANADGTVKVSGKKVGGATLAASPNANTLATEAAVDAAITANKLVWETL